MGESAGGRGPGGGCGGLVPPVLILSRLIILTDEALSVSLSELPDELT